MKDRVTSLLRVQPPLVENRGKLWGSGADYPTLGSDGWQIGAIWQNTSGAAGTSLYVNEGSVTSCDFVAVDTTAGASAGAINFDDNVTGPLIHIETTDPTNDSYTTPFIITGAYSSSADNALVVSATNTRPVSFLFEDGGDAFTGGDIRAGLFRLLLTVDQTAAVTINALRAQIKANNLVDITSPSAVTAPLTGYLELDGAGARHLDGHVACVRAALETGAGAHTVDINLVGFEATLNSSGTFVGSGYSAAYVANISGGTSLWQYGLYLESSAVLTAGVYLGSTAAGILAAGTIPTVLSVQHVGTVTSHVIDMIDAYTGMVIETGSYSSSASKGITLTTSNTRPVSILTDDGGQNLDSGVYRPVLSRVMLTVDQSGSTIIPVRGQLKLADLVDTETGIYAPVQGYIEVAGTSISKAGSTLSCLSASLEITTALTAAASGEVAGLHVETTGAGTLTATGTVAGVLIDKAAGAVDWPVGIQVSNTTTAINIGVCTSGVVITGATTYAIDIATSGVFRMGVQDTGVDLTTTYPFAVDVQCEANADIVAGATGSSAGIYARYAIGVAQTSQTNHIGVFAKLRVKADLADGNHVGVYGLVEISGTTEIGGTATTQTSAGFFAIDAAAGLDLSTGFLNGVLIDSSIATGATTTGVTAAIRVKVSASCDAWDYGIALEDTATVTGIAVGTCTTGITVDTCTTAIAVKDVITISPEAAGTLLDFILETEWVSGTMIRADLGGSTTFSGSVIGAAFDFGTNVVATSEQSVTGIIVTLPTSTNDAASPALVGFEVAVSGAMTCVTSGDPTYTGVKIATPAVDCTLDTIVSTGVDITLGGITQTGGTATSTGVKVTGGTITTGTAIGVDLAGAFSTGIQLALADQLIQLPASGTAPVETGGVVGTHGTATLKIRIEINDVEYFLLASTVPTFT